MISVLREPSLGHLSENSRLSDLRVCSLTGPVCNRFFISNGLPLTIRWNSQNIVSPKLLWVVLHIGKPRDTLLVLTYVRACLGFLNFKICPFCGSVTYSWFWIRLMWTHYTLCASLPSDSYPLRSQGGELPYIQPSGPLMRNRTCHSPNTVIQTLRMSSDLWKLRNVQIVKLEVTSRDDLIQPLSAVRRYLNSEDEVTGTLGGEVTNPRSCAKEVSTVAYSQAK